MERNFEKSGLKRELEDLIAKANAQIKANPQAIEQINDQLKKDFYEVMGRNQAAGWVDGPWVDALMKLTYRLAERGQRIKVNPARLVRQTKENNGRVRWLMEDEETTLRAIIEKKYSDHLPEFEISLMTGMRQEEQFSITWECVDLKAGIISLGDTKNGTGRMVRLNSRALAVMNMLHESSIGTGPVFLLNKKPRWFKDAVDEAKLANFTWHCLRHTWATRLLQKGVDVKTVQEMGGWKTIAMVMRYTHADPRRFGPALEKLCEVSATNSATQAESTQPPVAHGIQ